MKYLLSDATANWGYDSYRECYYFGHTYYQHIVNHNGHDLPMHVSIAQASETDYTQSMKDLKEHGLDWKINHVIYDAGHDSLGNYEYLMLGSRGRLTLRMTTSILFNPRKGVNPSPNAQRVNENGTPVCKVNEAMFLWKGKTPLL